MFFNYSMYVGEIPRFAFWGLLPQLPPQARNQPASLVWENKNLEGLPIKVSNAPHHAATRKKTMVGQIYFKGVGGKRAFERGKNILNIKNLKARLLPGGALGPLSCGPAPHRQNKPNRPHHPECTLTSRRIG